MAKKIQEFVDERVDTSTGEILSRTTKTFVRNTSAEDFIQVYLNDLSGLFALNGKIEHNLLSLLWRDTGFNTNKIFLLKPQKEAYAIEMDCKLDSINNAIISIVKKGLLLREERGNYYLNPKYFFKGETSRRKIIISYLKLDDNGLEPNIAFESEETYGK